MTATDVDRNVYRMIARSFPADEQCIGEVDSVIAEITKFVNSSHLEA
jgi:hypothetical protein